jgi:subtilisin-like proprotein convertase family protein
MQDRFTLKSKGRFFNKFFSLLIILLSAFAGNISAQCAWTASTVLTTPALDKPVAVVGTNLYAFSGVENGAIVSASQKFDGTTWTAIAPMPISVEFPSAVSDGTNIFIMGGAITGTGAPQNTNYRYNVATNTYTALATSASATWSHTAVFLSGKIYKIGGIAAAPSNAVNIYDIATNTWTVGAAYPQNAGFVSAIAANGFIYTAGGIDAAGSNKTYRYDPVANVWNDAAIADLPASRWGAATAFYRGGFVLAGGYTGGDLTANISTTAISWDPLTNAWTTIASMPSDRSRMTGTILNDAFYVVGGRSQASAGFVGSTSNFRLFCAPLVACAGTPAPGNTLASAQSVCNGTSVTFSALNPTAGTGVTYQWQTSASATGPWVSAPGASTNPTYTNTPTATAFYRVSVTCGAAVGSSTPIQVTTSACACLTPDIATICEGSVQSLQVNGPLTTPAGPTTVNSGVISIFAPDNTTTTATLNVNLPPNAITSMSVNFTMTHTWDSDMTFNLVSPTGRVINLINSIGGSADNFTNVTFSSTATLPIPTTAAGAPFTGTWIPMGVAGVGAPVQTNNTFASFITAVNAAGGATGAWRLTMTDGAGGDQGTLTNWNLTFNYNVGPTAIWTGAAGTMFTNSGATTAYVAGSPANTIWVNPTTTGTYTATIATGPCAGANNVTVTVLPKPVVSVTPLTSCGSPTNTLTASGAAVYAWTPSLGLSATTGASVIANPAVTTSYSVTGLATNGCFSSPVTATVNSSPTTAVMSALAGATFQINEGFTTVLPAGWARQNLSLPLGATNWGQGVPGTFPSFNGPTNAYASVNFLSTIGTASGEISNWLFTPVVNIKNGDQITFYTRTTTGATFPDRLEIRISTNGASVNVGATNLSVGDYTNLIYTVNPNLVQGPGTGVGTSGYPDTWTKITATVTGVPTTLSGRVAFRYFVTDGGGGNNSDFIGVDQVEYSTPASVNCANTVNNIKVDITGGVAPYTLVYSDGTANTTFNNYASGTVITVAPSVSTTYSVVSVTGANGCPVPSSGISGSAAITVTPVAAINTQPVNKSICVGANTTFTVVPNTTNGTTYQWEVNPGTGVWANATGGVYSGGTTATLTITGATASMLGYSYRVKVTGFCGGTPISTPATLTVVTPAGGTATLTNATVCTNASTTLTLGGTLTGGPGFTYQYQVSTDGGTTFANVNNGGIYSGATTTTLTITNPPIVNPKYQYRVVVNTVNACGGFNSTVATLTVNPLPVVTISAAPIVKLFPGLTSTLTAAVSNGTSPYTYQWIRNGASVATATTNSLVVGIDALGTYTLLVSDVNGCVAAAGTSTPGSIAISDSVTTDRLFIYPSPNRGQFQVRYFTNLSDGSKVPGAINIYDEKGTRVFSSLYSVGGGYQPMRVDLGAIHGKGVYRVDVIDTRGERLKTGSVMVF